MLAMPILYGVRVLAIRVTILWPIMDLMSAVYSRVEQTAEAAAA